MTVDTDLEPRGGAEDTERAGRGRRSLRQTAHEAKDLVRERADDVREQSRRYADAASRQLEGAQRRVTDTVRQRPITTGLAVVGAALLVGVFFAARSPRTLKRLGDTVRREL